jgi:hypothetical protein
MKKIFIFIVSFLLFVMPCLAKVDTNSEAYLKSKKHIAIMNPAAESVVQKAIKKQLKKETGADFDVKFTAYTLSSLKKGIFKYLELSGNDILVDGVEVPYVKLKTLTDYNWIDYKKDPPIMKSDMTFAYTLHLSEKTINATLKDKQYRKIIDNVNEIAYPLFVINSVSSRVKNSRVYIIMDYHLPLVSANKTKQFVVSTSFKVKDGKIYAYDLGLDRAYGSLSLNKVANLINLLDPLSFTLDLLDSKKCDGKIENIKIVDNIIQVDGKIYVKGE